MEALAYLWPNISLSDIFLQSTRKASMMCPAVIVVVAAPARRAGLTMSVHGGMYHGTRNVECES